jgi:hypothetical protein
LLIPANAFALGRRAGNFSAAWSRETNPLRETDKIALEVRERACFQVSRWNESDPKDLVGKRRCRNMR